MLKKLKATIIISVMQEGYIWLTLCAEGGLGCGKIGKNEKTIPEDCKGEEKWKRSGDHI